MLCPVAEISVFNTRLRNSETGAQRKRGSKTQPLVQFNCCEPVGRGNLPSEINSRCQFSLDAGFSWVAAIDISLSLRFSNQTLPSPTLQRVSEMGAARGAKEPSKSVCNFWREMI